MTRMKTTTTTTTNDPRSTIASADLDHVTGGGLRDWLSKARDKATEKVREGVEYVKQHPELIGTSRPLPR